eukprot:TRINITY_DN10680_c0_g1_i1.p1 TRINITY_DN10680_c0_g1~~TRINITY_DN10680_c0_g1_i1.p1  ORF type:complete len:435 (+),score=43.96 TRINITY_DN10680_c0_g1_i1:45-1349(+)
MGVLLKLQNRLLFVSILVFIAVADIDISYNSVVIGGVKPLSSKDWSHRNLTFWNVELTYIPGCPSDSDVANKIVIWKFEDSCLPVTMARNVLNGGGLTLVIVDEHQDYTPHSQYRAFFDNYPEELPIVLVPSFDFEEYLLVVGNGTYNVVVHQIPDIYYDIYTGIPILVITSICIFLFAGFLSYSVYRGCVYACHGGIGSYIYIIIFLEVVGNILRIIYWSDIGNVYYLSSAVSTFCLLMMQPPAIISLYLTALYTLETFSSNVVDKGSKLFSKYKKQFLVGILLFTTVSILFFIAAVYPPIGSTAVTATGGTLQLVCWWIVGILYIYVGIKTLRKLKSLGGKNPVTLRILFFGVGAQSILSPIFGMMMPALDSYHYALFLTTQILVTFNLGIMGVLKLWILNVKVAAKTSKNQTSVKTSHKTGNTSIKEEISE